MGQYTFDDSGTSFVYFIVALLALYAIPVGIYYVRVAIRVLRKHQEDCHCSDCNQKKRGGIAIKQRSPFKTKWFYAWVISFVAFIGLSVLASRTQLASIAFDPFSILDISSNADIATIKKRYKQLSLEWHPDRNPDNPEAEKKFINIAKAYKVLTDETTRATWEKYGNPDGATSFSLGIALPKWLIDQKNMIFVLGAYALVFGIIAPIFLSRWWKSSKRYTKDKILNDTMVVFFHELKDQMTTKKIMETITVAFEFKEKFTVVRPAESIHLSRLEKQLKHYEKSTRFYAPYCLKTAVLLQAHTERIPISDPQLQADQTFVVSTAAHLLTAIIQISAVRGWLTTTLAAIDLFPILVQGTRDELRQLPFYSDEMQRSLNTCKVSRSAMASGHGTSAPIQTMIEKTISIKSINDFLTKVNLDEKKKVFSSILKSHEMNELFHVVEKMPLLNAEVTATSASDDKSSTVIEGEPVNLTLKLQVNTMNSGESETSNIVDKEEENEEDLLDLALKEKLRKEVALKKQERLLVETPYFPNKVKPAWYIAFGQQQSGSLIGAPLRVIDLEDAPEKSIVIQFMAPPKAGLYALQIFIKSECYLGLDVKREVKLNVVEKKTEIGSTTNNYHHQDEKKPIVVEVEEKNHRGNAMNEQLADYETDEHSEESSECEDNMDDIE